MKVFMVLAFQDESVLVLVVGMECAPDASNQVLAQVVGQPGGVVGSPEVPGKPFDVPGRRSARQGPEVVLDRVEGRRVILDDGLERFFVYLAASFTQVLPYSGDLQGLEIGLCSEPDKELTTERVMPDLKVFPKQPKGFLEWVFGV
jgi:hypothetical protein